MNMAGAMVAVLGVIALFIGLRALSSNNHPVSTPTVDYKGWLRSVHQEGRLHGYVPNTMPRHWRATSASYRPGADPHWHLGVLAPGGKYVGIEEGLDSPKTEVHQAVEGGVTPSKPVTFAGHRWKTWTGADGDYAVARRVRAPKGKRPETLLVVGTGSPAQVRSFAASLR